MAAVERDHLFTGIHTRDSVPRFRATDKGPASAGWIRGVGPGEPGFPLSDGYLKTIRGTNRVREIESLPNVRSLDRGYLAAIVQYADLMRAGETPVRTEKGRRLFYGRTPGALASYAFIRTASVQMTPEGGPAATNKPTVLSWEPSVRQLRAARLMGRLLFEGHTPDSRYAIRKGSSSGPFLFTKDGQEKKDLLARAVANRQLLADLAAAMSDVPTGAGRDDALQRISALLCEAHQLGLSANSKAGRRYQVDGATWEGDDPVPKQRAATDAYGDYFPNVTRTIDLYGWTFARARSRLVYNLAAGLNQVQQVHFSQWRFDSLNNHRRAFKGLTEQEKDELDDRFPFTITSDAKECDHQGVWWMAQTWAAVMCEMGYPPFLAWLSLLMFFAPNLVPNDHVGGKGAMFLGDPAAADHYRVLTGNPSGIFNNGDFNKWAVLTDLFLRMLDHGLIAVGGTVFSEPDEDALAIFEAMLTHTHPTIAIENRGDNLRIRCADERTRNLVEAAVSLGGGDTRPQAVGKYLYIHDIDPWGLFEGEEDIIVEHKPRRGIDVRNAINKFVSREYNWGISAQPASGAKERRDRMYTNPEGARAYDLWVVSTKHLFDGASDFDAFIEKQAAVEAQRLPFSDLTAVEREVLEDSSKLSWKYSWNDVRPEIAEMFGHVLTDAERAAHRTALAFYPDEVPWVPYPTPR